MGRISRCNKREPKKIKKYPGMILQVSCQLASSINTEYDEYSAIIGSNLAYAAIHQLGGKAGRNEKVEIPVRPYLALTDNNFKEILEVTEKYFRD